MNKENIREIRNIIKQETIYSIDPVAWIENNLTIEGMDFSIRDSGRAYLVEIYRYIALNAILRTGKPVVIYKGRQVEASTMALALDLYFVASGLFGNLTQEEREKGIKKLPRIRVLHCQPQDKQVDRFIKEKVSTLINNAKADCVNKHKTKGGADTDRIKQFIGDNFLVVESTGVDGDRIRGLSFDIIFFDEFQDFLPRAIANTGRTQMGAIHGPIGRGAQVYFGTPKERGRFFEKTWEKSDKRFYNLKCKQCNNFFPMFVPYTDSWKQIWVRGNIVRCPACGFEQDKIQAVNNGKWIATNPGAPIVGFHFNRFIHPDTTKEQIIDKMPENDPLTTEKEFRNEVLGEFSTGKGSGITPQEIAEKCADYDRPISTVGIPNLFTYLGIDWGKKVEGKEGGDSYSVAVIIEAHGDLFRILNAFQLKTRDFSKKIGVIEEIYKRYNVRQSVADLGYGEDLVSELQKKLMSRMLGWYNNVNYKDPYKYRKGDYYILANKDRMIEHAFELIKEGKIRFPFGSYEDIHFLIEHCCSMEVDIKKVREQEFNRYVKGGKPNDGLMALCYAILAYKYVISEGFTVSSNIMKIKQYKEAKKKPAIIGYIPRWK